MGKKRLTWNATCMKNKGKWEHFAHFSKVTSSLPGTITAFVFSLMGCSFLSQLRSGGGNPETSQVKEMKLFTTTVRFSGLGPMTLGGTIIESTLEVKSDAISNTYSNLLI